MYILSPQQTAKADKATIENTGITSVDLMEHAATNCFQWLHNKLHGGHIQIHVSRGTGTTGGELVFVLHNFYKNHYLGISSTVYFCAIHHLDF